jgi:hypothetical protein
MTTTVSEPMKLAADTYEHLPKLHQAIADMMVERGELILETGEVIDNE